MYVATFYSFKGGVGRSMALMNVGYALAAEGKRVLLVDFDLEAPGLDTFPIELGKSECLGVLEFVSEFVRTNESPDVRDYVVEAAVPMPKGGRLWMMPSGRSDETYGARLSALDWERLYAERDGYLLLEDLKRQWQEAFAPDYVLVDSRTGHTDVSGICTRQLPDAVVLLFFPNEQNLRGLVRVASDIRAEIDGPRARSIRLHWVMSNVPDLDDEDEILRSAVDRFKEELDIPALAQTVHRYESFDLVKQCIFVKDRPRSRLARQYRELAATVSRFNPEDRDGVLARIKGLQREGAPAQSVEDDYLSRVRVLFRADGEILVALASYYRSLGEPVDAASLIDRALSVGFKTPEALLLKAEVEVRNNPHTAVQFVLAACDRALDGDGLFLLYRAASIVREHGTPEQLTAFLESVAFRGLDPSERVELLEGWRAREEEMLAMLKVVEDARASGAQIRPSEFEITLISLGRFHAAMEEISPKGEPNPAEMDVQDAFNYGVACWGATGVVDTRFFAAVVAAPNAGGPNYEQCLALSHWAVGNVAEARAHVDAAQRAIEEYASSDFSCWRYLKAPVTEFIKDLHEMRSMIDGEHILPMVIRKRSGQRTLQN